MVLKTCCSYSLWLMVSLRLCCVALSIRWTSICHRSSKSKACSALLSQSCLPRTDAPWLHGLGSKRRLSKDVMRKSAVSENANDARTQLRQGRDVVSQGTDYGVETLETSDKVELGSALPAGLYLSGPHVWPVLGARTCPRISKTETRKSSSKVQKPTTLAHYRFLAA